MINLLHVHLPRLAPEWNLDRVHSAIRDAARTTLAEHALAMHAATKAAASSRACLDDVRAMYALPPPPD